MASSSQVVTSAPGKVILFGEHAVVKGKMAVATALSLRTYASFQLEKATSVGNAKLHIKLPDLQAEYEWTVNQDLKDVLAHPLLKEISNKGIFGRQHWKSSNRLLSRDSNFF